MFFLLIFCILIKSTLPNYDIQLDFSTTDYFLFLTANGIEIRSSSSTENNGNVVYSNNNVIDNTIHLDLGVLPDPISHFNLKISQTTCTPFNLDINIDNLLQSTENFEISFFDSWLCINNFDIKFHIEQPFIYFSNVQNNVNLTVLILNTDQLIASIPSSNREKFIICYNSTDCSNQDDFLIQPDEVYLSLIDDIKFEEVVSRLLTNLNIKYLRLLYPGQNKISFPKIPMNQIQQLELIGHSTQNPTLILLNEKIETKLIPKWIIQNIQFAIESLTSEFNFQEVFIKDTSNVFPDKGIIHIDTTREYRKSDSSTSPFQNITSINKSIFEIFPDFGKNGDITMSFKTDEITVTGSSSEKIASIPLLTNPFIFIRNQRNKENKKIRIIHENEVRSFSIQIENSDSIPIEFIDWEDINVNVDFYTRNISDIHISFFNSSSLSYHHFNLEKTRLFNEHPIEKTKFVFCLSSDECDQPNFYGSDVLQIPIQGSDSATVLQNFYNQLDELNYIDFTHFIIILKKENDGIELDLGSYLNSNNLNQFRIINCDKEKNPIQIKMKSLPSSQNIFWEINKCHLSYELIEEQDYLIQELLSIDDGKIEGERIKILKTNYVKNVDLTLNDQIITISENYFEFLNTIVKSIDSIKFIVKSELNTLHNFIFQHKDFVEKTTDIIVDFESFDDKSLNIPILISEKWHQLPIQSIGKIKINIQTNEHIIFNSIPDKVHIEVYNKEENPKLLAQVPVECSQDKLVICYNSDDCAKQNGFSIQNDEIFLSTKTDNEFLSLMESINKNSYKYYQFMKIILVSDNEVKFESIPHQKIGQIQLKGYNSPFVSLTDQTNTENIKSLFVSGIKFRRSTTNEILFNEVIVSNTSDAFPDEQFTFTTARIIIKPSYDSTTFDSLKNKMSNLIYDLYPDFNEGKDYSIIFDAERIYPNGYLTDSGKASSNPMISSPPIDNFSFYIHGSTNPNFNKIIINRLSSIPYNQINLMIDNFTDILPIECISSETNENLNIQIYAFDVSKIQIGNNCNENSIKTTVNKYQDLPIPTISPSQTPFPTITDFPTTYFFTKSATFSPFPFETPVRTQIVDNTIELPIIDILSDSVLFEMIENGFIENENENPTTINKSEKVVNTVTFTQKEITITESSEYISILPLYFIASEEGSKIHLTENVANSNIGVSSNNSPTVILSKHKHPLSFVNSNDQGSVQIDLNEGENNKNFINLNHINNKHGSFQLTVPNTIKTVSFASIIMSKLSSLFISSQNENNRQIKDDEISDNDLTIEVRNLLNITSLSEASVLSSIILNGDVSLFDDSTLIFHQSATFSNSNLKIVFHNSNQTRKNSIIKVNKKLDSTPSRIILSNDLNDGELINVKNLVLVEATNFATCEIWRQKIGFENGRDGQIESKCEEIQDGTNGETNINILSLYAKETVPNKEEKLSIGAIIGIVVGCIASIVFIVLVVYLLYRCGHSSDVSTDISVEQDSIGL